MTDGAFDAMNTIGLVAFAVMGALKGADATLDPFGVAAGRATLGCAAVVFALRLGALRYDLDLPTI